MLLGLVSKLLAVAKLSMKRSAAYSALPGAKVKTQALGFHSKLHFTQEPMQTSSHVHAVVAVSCSLLEALLLPGSQFQVIYKQTKTGRRLLLRQQSACSLHMNPLHVSCSTLLADAVCLLKDMLGCERQNQWCLQ